ncbi:hypothetical protein KR222_008853, partial [Zaprionus bogoriensis]
PSSICQLLLVTCLAACCQAIRVDWGTNTGPIVPPPPRTTPTPPRQPYREPAPVWEDQSDDIPNPKPYLVRPVPAGAGAGPATGTVSVPALAAQYVPGVGIKYTAIVPDKLQGKYNAKTKKYKAYEKTGKYVPWNYVRQYDTRKPPSGSSTEAAASTTAGTSSSSSSTTTTQLPKTTTTTKTKAATTTTTHATTTAAATTSTTTTTTATPAEAASVANFKLAHEKSAYLKKHNKLKKLLEQLH